MAGKRQRRDACEVFLDVALHQLKQMLDSTPLLGV